MPNALGTNALSYASIAGLQAYPNRLDQRQLALPDQPRMPTAWQRFKAWLSGKPAEPAVERYQEGVRARRELLGGVRQVLEAEYGGGRALRRVLASSESKQGMAPSTVLHGSAVESIPTDRVQQGLRQVSAAVMEYQVSARLAYEEASAPTRQTQPVAVRLFSRYLYGAINHALAQPRLLATAVAKGATVVTDDAHEVAPQHRREILREFRTQVDRAMWFRRQPLTPAAVEAIIERVTTRHFEALPDAPASTQVHQVPQVLDPWITADDFTSSGQPEPSDFERGTCSVLRDHKHV